MRIDVLTVFPGYLAPLHESLVGKAIARGDIELGVHDLRSWTHDVHHSVDDAPYGGGPGMVMRPNVWGDALDDVLGTDSTLIVPTPAGRLFDQPAAAELAQRSHLVFACGRYEGIDQRVIDDAARRVEVRELSIGDYVLAGGEVAVLVMVEALARLRPGVLGNADSARLDSHSDGLLEGPSYTRPEVWRELAVPEVLRSGNHAAIQRWRRDESLRRTAQRRPDLLAAYPGRLDKHDQQVLAEHAQQPDAQQQ
ncbi:tRNA (guanosine(37)-N1)-methyltransferase TrmD [Epidermidibacterium keratini]|uniref:tRNA (guanine-N(1)-)-methyltransferase n=1 Tax=Epidermidibacterium keratini TaxID=1891644 RepID=A0A7L4YRR1_9ACTN|nr:tRNA (guanosine(37)-N1)-methyltransferase TrmD [Epidermidibacterium keratini]QHC01846.1 tRNA (guanosine(37)-N1)-methyltransferase TrmD [Epidermidibacterium keratini]